VKIKIDHTRVSVLERARRHEPKTPGEIGILRENLQPSVVFVFPERADISECPFLHGSIGGAKRAGKAEPTSLPVTGSGVTMRSKSPTP
jgi:hypothetical protein